MAARDSLMHSLLTARKLALSSGCDEAEAFGTMSRARIVDVEQNLIKAASSIIEEGLFVRVTSGKRVGLAFSNSLTKDGIASCVRSATKLSKIAEEDSQWHGFAPAKKKSQSMTGLLDSRTSSLELSDLREMADQMMHGALSVSKAVTVTGGQVQTYHRMLGICNSSGVEQTMGESRISAFCSSVSGKGRGVSPDCLDIRVSRKPDINFEALGRSSGRIAVLCSTNEEPKTEESDVVLSPLAVGAGDMGILSVMMSRGSSGESVIRKNTFLIGKLGEQVASKNLTISDNPLAKGRSGSRPFDDEGTPTSRTELITNGVLKGFLWNSYFGNIAGHGSTGNAVRDLSTGSLSISPLNLEVQPGKGNWESLASKIDHGYLVWACQGAHTSNFESGAYSFVPSPCLLIKKGEVVGGVRGAMVSGNVLELMKNLEMVGSDVTDLGSGIMPSMSFRELKITAG